MGIEALLVVFLGVIFFILIVIQISNLMLCYFLNSRVNNETSTIEYYFNKLNPTSTKGKETNKQNYYSEILGVNIHDGYINSVALWTFAVIA